MKFFDCFKKKSAPCVAKDANFVVDPVEGDVWDMEYLAVLDGDEITLAVDPELAFSAVINGEKMGAEQLIAAGYVLMNDAGIEFGLDKAKEISAKILAHSE